MINEKLKNIIENSIKESLAKKEIGKLSIKEILLERPKEKIHGHFSSNIAFILSSQAKKPPQIIADIIASKIQENIGKYDFLERVEVAGNGFINFFLSRKYFYSLVKEIEKKKNRYGENNLGKGKRIQIEFVSANPVGPLHIGHGRWAAVGDALANILKASNYVVEKEFYINDYGTQIEKFALSVEARYMELLGKKVIFPEDGYRGAYIKDIAQEIVEKDGDKYLKLSQDKRIEIFRKLAYKQVINHLKKILKNFGVVFDNWFSELVLHKSGAIGEVLKLLEKKRYVYRKDNATWLATSKFGDDKDRVLVRESREPTYFLSDIAYHQNKMERGFDKLINIWGADHHGYVKRVEASMQALGYPKDKLEIIIGQMVNLMRAGVPVRMSKRTGEMVTFEELIEEVGNDVARYLFLTKSVDTPFDFDIKLAKEKSMDNPVYYIQYAHARICNILKFAQEKGIKIKKATEVDLNLLDKEEEFDLMNKLSEYPDVVKEAAKSRAPHRLTTYAEELATLFHYFYTKHRVVTKDIRLSQARLVLVNCTLIVIRNIFSLLGVSAPERM